MSPKNSWSELLKSKLLVGAMVLIAIVAAWSYGMASAAEVSHPVIRGWVVFDGTGVVDVKDGHNVLSVTDDGTGQYTINWIVPFVNPFYSIAGTCGKAGSDNDCYVILRTNGPNDESVSISTVRGDRQLADFAYVSLMAIGN